MTDFANTCIYCILDSMMQPLGNQGLPNFPPATKNKSLGASWLLEFGEVLIDKQLTSYQKLQLATKNINPGVSVAHKHFGQCRALVL